MRRGCKGRMPAMRNEYRNGTRTTTPTIIQSSDRRTLANTTTHSIATVGRRETWVTHPLQKVLDTLRHQSVSFK